LLRRQRDLKELLSSLDKKVSKIEKKARFRSNLLGYSISSVLLAQLMFITQGTFVTLSWDIMEPISYMISMFNFTCGFGWYYLFITKPDSQTPTDWMKNRIMTKQMKKQGAD